ERHFAVGDYPLQNRAERSGIHFAYPILNEQGSITTVIFAALDLLWVQQLAAENKLPEGVALSIVDSKGTLLARFPDPEKWIGKHIPDASLFEMLQLRSRISTSELVGLDGVDRLYALKPIPRHATAGQVYVMVGIPKEVAFGQANQALTRGLIWLGIVS